MPAFSQPDIAVYPPFANFGNVRVGVKFCLIFRVVNEGDQNLQISSMGITGPNAGEFSADQGGGATLPPAGSITIVICLTPASPGPKSAVFRVASNDPDENPFNASLTGFGVAGPDIQISPLSMDFGGAGLSSSVLRQFAVSNPGDAALVVTAVGLEGVDAADFRLENPGAFTLLPGQTRTVDVSFAPAAIGPKQAVLFFESNDPDQARLQVALTGTATPLQRRVVIRVEPAGCGTVLPPPGEYFYDDGSSVEVSAAAASGYRFLSWSKGAAEPEHAATTVLINWDIVITALFAPTDVYPPYLTGCYPVPGSKEIPGNTDIRFLIKDKGNNVDFQSLSVWVDDTLRFRNGADAAFGLCQIARRASGIDAAFRSLFPFNKGVKVKVRVKCSDASLPANGLDSTYSFSIGSSLMHGTRRGILGPAGLVFAGDSLEPEIVFPGGSGRDSVEVSAGDLVELPNLPAGFLKILRVMVMTPLGLCLNDSVFVRIAVDQGHCAEWMKMDSVQFAGFAFSTIRGKWESIPVKTISAAIIEMGIREFGYLAWGFIGKSITAVGEVSVPVAGGFMLAPNHPNPFNASTRIDFTVARAGWTNLRIYDTAGRLVRLLVSERRQPGRYSEIWGGQDDHGRPVSSGLYLAALETDGRFLAEKMCLIR